MKARVHDPLGPRWSRSILPGVGVTYAFFSLYWVSELGPPLDSEFYYGVLMAFLGPFMVGRNSPAMRELELENGAIKILGLFPTIVRSKDIEASISTTTESGTFALGLVLKSHGKEPVLFEFESATEAVYAREALGLSEHGFGTVEWERAGLWVSLIGRLCLVAWAIGVGYFIDTNRPLSVVSFTILFFSVLLYIALAIAKLSTEIGPSARILSFTSKMALDPDKLSFIEPLSRLDFPYARISDVRVDQTSGAVLRKTHLWLEEKRPDGGKSTHRFRVETTDLLRVGVTPEELDILVSLVRSAARRAAGLEGTTNVSIAKTAPILPQPGEVTISWVGRLDQVGSAIRGGSPYPFSEGDLWTVLSDANASPWHRFAAGRVLFAKDPRIQTRMSRILERIPIPSERSLVALSLESNQVTLANRLLELTAREA